MSFSGITPYCVCGVTEQLRRLRPSSLFDVWPNSFYYSSLYIKYNGLCTPDFNRIMYIRKISTLKLTDKHDRFGYLLRILQIYWRSSYFGYSLWSYGHSFPNIIQSEIQFHNNCTYQSDQSTAVSLFVII